MKNGGFMAQPGGPLTASPQGREVVPDGLLDLARPWRLDGDPAVDLVAEGIRTILQTATSQSAPLTGSIEKPLSLDRS